MWFKFFSTFQILQTCLIFISPCPVLIITITNREKNSNETRVKEFKPRRNPNHHVHYSSNHNILWAHAVLLDVLWCVHENRRRKCKIKQPVDNILPFSKFLKLCIQTFKTWSLIVRTFHIVASLVEFWQFFILSIFKLKRNNLLQICLAYRRKFSINEREMYLSLVCFSLISQQ